MMWADSGRVLVAFGALAVFGVLYNALVAWMEGRGYDEGYTAILVVVGVAVTLAGLWCVYDLAVALTALGLFAASGGPMVGGSMWRHMRARERGEAAIRGEVLEGATGTPGASHLGGDTHHD